MQVVILWEATVGQNRKIYTAEFKSKVAMEAIRGRRDRQQHRQEVRDPSESDIHLENGTDRRRKQHL